MSTSVVKALPGKLDIKRHSPSILYISASLAMSTSGLKAMPGKPDIKRHAPSILYISASIAMSSSVLKALPGKLDIKDTHLVFFISRQASRCQQAFSKPRLVNLISKDTHLEFSESQRCQQAFSKPIIKRHSPSILYIYESHLYYSDSVSGERFRSLWSPCIEFRHLGNPVSRFLG